MKKLKKIFQWIFFFIFWFINNYKKMKAAYKLIYEFKERGELVYKLLNDPMTREEGILKAIEFFNPTASKRFIKHVFELEGSFESVKKDFAKFKKKGIFMNDFLKDL